MFVDKITYTDFDGVERTEECRFNLTDAEVVQLELQEKGTFTDLLRRIIDAKNTSEIITEVDRLLMASYGEKSPDGRYFDKSPEVKARFKSSAMYSQVFMKLMTDDEYGANFINNVIPKDIGERFAKELAKSRTDVIAPDANVETTVVQPGLISPLM